MDDEVASIALSQAEIDKVLNAVRSDNEENAAQEDEGVAITQEELERLFAGPSIPFKFPGAKKEEDTPSKTPSTPPKEQNDDREAKIAERKDRMQEMLDKANASAPKRISVTYGTVLKTGADIENAKEGTVVELDRLSSELAEIYVDGNLWARGKLGNSKNGHAAIKITQIL